MFRIPFCTTCVECVTCGHGVKSHNVCWCIDRDAFAGDWEKMEVLVAKCAGSAPLRMALWDYLVSQFYLGRTSDTFDPVKAHILVEWLTEEGSVALQALPETYIRMLTQFMGMAFADEAVDLFFLSPDSSVEATRLVSTFCLSVNFCVTWCAFVGIVLCASDRHYCLKRPR